MHARKDPERVRDDCQNYIYALLTKHEVKMAFFSLFYGPRRSRGS